MTTFCRTPKPAYCGTAAFAETSVRCSLLRVLHTAHAPLLLCCCLCTQVLLESSNTSSVTTVTLPLLITGRAEVAASDIKVYITGTTAAVPLRDAKVWPC
jgi:hypothetical protein